MSTERQRTRNLESKGASAPMATHFYPDDALVPDGLRAEGFVLLPLTAAHNALDYEAVMATQETLRQLGGDVAAARLHARGKPRRPGGTRGRLSQTGAGSPTRSRLRMGPAAWAASTPTRLPTPCAGREPTRQPWRGSETTRRRCGSGSARKASPPIVDRQLAAALVPWFRNKFAFARVVFVTWAVDERQVAALRDAGLKLVWSNPVRDTQVLHFA